MKMTLGTPRENYGMCHFQIFSTSTPPTGGRPTLNVAADLGRWGLGRGSAVVACPSRGADLPAPATYSDVGPGCYFVRDRKPEAAQTKSPGAYTERGSVKLDQ